MVSAAYAKTQQIITTVTKRTEARLDAYAAASEQSRAGAVRGFIHAGLDKWEREQSLTWVDSSALAEGHEEDSTEA
jgi:hypothetical protein